MEDNSCIQIIYNQENKDSAFNAVNVQIEKEKETDKTLESRLENTEAALKVALKYIEKLELEIANYHKEI